MKLRHIFTIILFSFIANLSVAQTIDFDLIEYKGLRFFSSKSEIVKKMGKPQKIYDPEYDCGFLSTATQDGVFLTLDYDNIKFTGNKKERYVLDYVNFENDHSIIVKYGNRNLSHKTNLSELIDIFGDEVAKSYGDQKDGDIIIFEENQKEDGIRIRIKNGKLVWIEY